MIKLNENKINYTIETSKSDQAEFEFRIKLVFQDYSSESKTQNEKIVKRVNFYKYTQLIPIKIAEKMFNCFNIRNTNELSFNELANPFMTLKFGTSEQICRLLFDIFDFDKDGNILISDLLMLMSYLPSNLIISDKINNDYSDSSNYLTINVKQQIDSFSENFHNNIDIFSFTKAYLENNNNILTTFLKFLYDNIPIFFSKSLAKFIKPSNSLLEKTADISSPIKTGSNEDGDTITNPKELINIIAEDIDHTKKLKRKHNTEIIHIDPKLSPILTKRYDNTHQISNSIKLELNPKDNSSFKNYKVEYDNFEKDQLTKEGSFYISTYESANIQKMTKIYIKIFNNDTLYYYDDKKNTRFFKSNLLFGSFIKKKKFIKLKNQKYWSFTIIFPNEKTETFYHKDFNVINDWGDYLRWSLDYRNIFDHYEMASLKGEGGQGKVFCSQELSTKKAVAIKVVEKSVEGKSKWIDIKSEIDIMKSLNHPNIVKFIDTFDNSEYSFIVMEYLKYGSLGKYLKNKKFNLKEKNVANIVHQIAEGIRYLHSIGIVHRDLKPGNIIISSYTNDDNITVKITDFGLSKTLGKLENLNEIGGTFLFVAPEIIHKKAYNNKIDIWSFGITVYYIVFGKYPFSAAKSKNKDSYNLDFKNQSYIENLNSKSKELKDLITRCLTLNPEERIDIEGILNHHWFDILKQK